MFNVCWILNHKAGTDIIKKKNNLTPKLHCYSSQTSVWPAATAVSPAWNSVSCQQHPDAFPGTRHHLMATVFHTMQFTEDAVCWFY